MVPKRIDTVAVRNSRVPTVVITWITTLKIVVGKVVVKLGKSIERIPASVCCLS